MDQIQSFKLIITKKLQIIHMVDVSNYYPTLALINVENMEYTLLKCKEHSIIEMMIIPHPYVD